MKIYRFNLPEDLPECFQKSVVWATTPPSLDEELSLWLEEITSLPRWQRKQWIFGFTSKQFAKACRWVKKQGKFCTYKKHLQWHEGLKVTVFEVANPVIFRDQVIFNTKDIKKEKKE